jgi:Fe-S cluster biogenesis protein NfuA
MEDERPAENAPPAAPGPPSIEAASERLRDARARLRAHGGDVVVRGVGGDGEVELEFTGACRGCPAIGFTYGAVVEPALGGLAGVKAVKAPQVSLSPAAIGRIRRFAGVVEPAPEPGAAKPPIGNRSSRGRRATASTTRRRGGGGT